MLKFINIKTDKQSVPFIQKLYQKAFPKEEQVPFFYLRNKAKKQHADLYGIYDDANFIGMLYTITYQDIIFVFYLAIEESCQSMGYGSKLLQQLKIQYPGYRMILNMEEVDEQSEGYAQQVSRRKFYLHNGFVDANIKTREKDVVYDMMVYGGELSYDEYAQLVKSFMGKRFFHLYYEQILP